MLDIRIPTIVINATSYSPSMVCSTCRAITCVTTHLSLHRGHGYCTGMSLLFYLIDYLPDGSVQWLLGKPCTSSIKQCAWYCTSAPRRPSERPSKKVYFSSSLFCLHPWRPPEQYGVSSHLMAASRGFWHSHEHVALDDVLRIAPAHC